MFDVGSNSISRPSISQINFKVIDFKHLFQDLKNIIITNLLKPFNTGIQKVKNTFFFPCQCFC